MSSWINIDIVNYDFHKAVVYRITNLDTGEKYIGKRNLFSKTSKPPLKGRKNKRWTITIKDLESYQSSSEEVKQWTNVKKEILRTCTSIGESTYLETKLLFEYDVLNPNNEYVNKNIGGKFFRWYLIVNGGVKFSSFFVKKLRKVTLSTSN